MKAIWNNQVQTFMIPGIGLLIQFGKKIKVFRFK